MKLMERVSLEWTRYIERGGDRTNNHNGRSPRWHLVGEAREVLRGSSGSESRYA